MISRYRLYLSVVVVALLVAGCGQSTDSPTGSSPAVTENAGGPSQSTVAPSPEPRPASTPTGDRPYVVFSEPLGNGEFCNPMAHPLTVSVKYYDTTPGYDKQVLLETRHYAAQPKTCVFIPPAKEVVKFACGTGAYLQVDAATTEHLGHVFVTVVAEPCPQPTPQPTPTPTPSPTPYCKPWYPGTPPANGARITFMSKTSTGKYLWRIQNGTTTNVIAVGLGNTLVGIYNVPAGTVGAFTTDSPKAGLSIYNCSGTKLHGTASSNEKAEPWCSYPESTPSTCES